MLLPVRTTARLYVPFHQRIVQESGSPTQGSFLAWLAEIVGSPTLPSGKQPPAIPIRWGRAAVYQNSVVPHVLQKMALLIVVPAPNRIYECFPLGFRYA